MEIVSPSTKSRDLGVKLFRYRMLGVKEYWVVNPDTKETTMYFFGPEVGESEEVYQMKFDEAIESRLYPGLSVVIGDLLE